MFLRRIRMFLPMSHAMTNKLETPNTVPLNFPLKLNAAPPLNQGPSWHGYQEKRRWRGKEKNCCNLNRANSIAALYSISLKNILKHCVQAFYIQQHFCWVPLLVFSQELKSQYQGNNISFYHVLSYIYLGVYTVLNRWAAFHSVKLKPVQI